MELLEAVNIKSNAITQRKHIEGVPRLWVEVLKLAIEDRDYRWLRGSNCARILNHLGISRDKFLTNLRKLNTSRLTHTNELKEAFYADVEIGLPLTTLAAKYGIHKNLASIWCTKKGINVKAIAQRERDRRNTQIKQEWSQEFNVDVLAKRWGLTKASIKSIVKNV